MVICDDINLPFGTLRLRRDGSDGGHNGLKSIIESIGTREFARLRMGVGHDFQEGQQIDFVLGQLDAAQQEMLPELSAKTREGVQTWILSGIDRAMNFVNTKNCENK